MRVYAVTENIGNFLMFIADMGEVSAHRNVAKTAHMYTAKIVAYEFRNGYSVRRYDMNGALLA